MKDSKMFHLKALGVGILVASPFMAILLFMWAFPLFTIITLFTVLIVVMVYSFGRAFMAYHGIGSDDTKR